MRDRRENEEREGGKITKRDGEQREKEKEIEGRRRRGKGKGRRRW